MYVVLVSSHRCSKCLKHQWGTVVTKHSTPDAVKNFYECASAVFSVFSITHERPGPSSCAQAVVFLDRDEFKSTWLGNKSIYRTRMAMEDGGELIVMAPGVTKFGEDPDIDALIRRVGLGVVGVRGGAR